MTALNLINETKNVFEVLFNFFWKNKSKPKLSNINFTIIKHKLSNITFTNSPLGNGNQSLWKKKKNRTNSVSWLKSCVSWLKSCVSWLKSCVCCVLSVGFLVKITCYFYFTPCEEFLLRRWKKHYQNVEKQKHSQKVLNHCFSLYCTEEEKKNYSKIKHSGEKQS